MYCGYHRLYCEYVCIYGNYLNFCGWEQHPTLLLHCVKEKDSEKRKKGPNKLKLCQLERLVLPQFYIPICGALGRHSEDLGYSYPDNEMGETKNGRSQECTS